MSVLSAIGKFGVAGLVMSGCKDWRIDSVTPASTGPIDVHCHVFNARDLPIRSFARNVLLEEYPALPDGVLTAFQYVLQTPAPDYAAERDLLHGLIDGEESSFDVLEEIEPPPGLLNEALDDLQRRFPDAYDELLLDQDVEPGLEADGALIGTPVERAVHWAWVITRYRTQIAYKLARTFDDVALFTPALVDFDLWVGGEGDVQTPLSEQVELYGLISEWSQGRFHGFVAFDPWRELVQPKAQGSTLSLVNEAVLRQGFVGVKLYPPMGFRPLGNTELWPSNDVRRNLDDALRSLYAWCQEHDVPILAHCNESNGAAPGFAERASPVYWAGVLQEFPELRLCLGHFGGAAGLRDNPKSSWAWKIAELMQNHTFVYADTGFHDIGLEPESSDADAYLDGLTTLFNSFPAARERLVFGSDWQMILIREGHADYLDRYRERIRNRFGEELAVAFSKENARRLLGIDNAGAGNRLRLREFYDARSMPYPAWYRT